MGEILDRSLHIDSQIALQYSTVETMRVMFEEVCQMISRRSDLCTCPRCVRLSAHCKPVLLYANIDFWVAKLGKNLFIKVIESLFCLSFHTFYHCHQVWDETFQRVNNEQEIYEGDNFKTLFL